MTDIDRKLEKIQIKKALIQQELARSYHSLKEQISPFYWASGAGLAILNHYIQSGSTASSEPVAGASSPPRDESTISQEGTTENIGSLILNEALEYLKYRMEKESA